jgi:Flp pilus assembly pilin Flp
MTRPVKQMVRLLRDESGQDLVEYGLLIGVITAAVVMTVTAIGAKVNQYYNDLNSNLQTT